MKLGYRLSGTVEDESCRLSSPLRHRDGRTLFDVYCITCPRIRPVLQLRRPVRTERFFRDRPNRIYLYIYTYIFSPCVFCSQPCFFSRWKISDIAKIILGIAPRKINIATRVRRSCAHQPSVCLLAHQTQTCDCRIKHLTVVLALASAHSLDVS